jgi:site-specific recombinase XerD
MLMPSNNAQLIADFVAYLQIERGAKENTVASYSHDLTHFSRWLGQSFTPICSAISPVP